MALVGKSGGNGGNKVAQPVIEPDVYTAYLVQVIDLGLQAQRPYKGEDKPPVHMISVTYELSDVFMLDEDGVEQEDKPRWISEEFPLHSLKADRAKSTARYKAFDPDEEHGGDWSLIAGQAVNVTTANNKSGDKIYTNVSNVAPMNSRKRASMAPIKNPVRVFVLDSPDLEVFNSFPEWIQEKIKNNLNYAGSPLEALLGKKSSSKPAPTPAPDKAESKADEDDNNPY